MTYRATVESLIAKNCSGNLSLRVSTHEGRGDASPSKKDIELLIESLKGAGVRVEHGQGGLGEDISINGSIVTPFTEAGWAAIESCVPSPLFLQANSSDAAYSGKFYGLATNRHDEGKIRKERFYDAQTDWSRK